MSKVTLTEILNIYNAVDDDVIEIDHETIQLTGDELQAKIDSFVTYIKDCKSRAKELKERSKEIEGRAKALVNRANNITDYLKYVMEQNGFEKLPGNLYRVSLVKSKPKIVMDRDCTDDDLQNHFDFVRTRLHMTGIKLRLLITYNLIRIIQLKALN